MVFLFYEYFRFKCFDRISITLDFLNQNGGNVLLFYQICPARLKASE